MVHDLESICRMHSESCVQIMKCIQIKLILNHSSMKIMLQNLQIKYILEYE